MKKENKWKRFNIFDMNRDGKGVEKDDVLGPPDLKTFFKTFGRRFNKLLSLNLIMWARFPMYALVALLASYMLYSLGGIFEILFATVASLLGTPVLVSTSPLYGTVVGANTVAGSIVDGIFVSGSASTVTLSSIFSGLVDMPTYSPLFYTVIIALFLFSVITWGWQSVGAAYISRSLVRADPVFPLSDYFYAIKKNLRQGFVIGLIDALILLVLTFDFCYLFVSSTGVLSEIFLFMIGGMMILYYFMRKYIYLLCITFDMKTSKIFKNALIFTVLGLKRNLVGALGSLLLLAVNIALGILCMGFNFIIPLMLPLVYFIGTSNYISAYSVYPVIDKYMIEPYKKPEVDE